MKYIKKPVAIEAIQVVDTKPETITMISKFMGGCCTEDSGEGFFILIETLEGTMRAGIEDWIIKGVNGEFYPCKPDIFEKTYTKFEESHIGRMKIEVQELEEKYKKLHEFMVTKKFCELEKYQRQLIASQEMLMEGYIDILHKRIQIDEKIKKEGSKL